ncbi:hypothetical protein TIFTF001_021711 [Ficus carica]|uniref:Uncharacterized protein n=1 Tax=Ficus carica TaxID=3494 RepID=A0AA88AD88_FICCA|nr:hypothetical protein TIFTF001_021711 [Ficus carica]
MLDGMGAQATEPLTASHGRRCGGRRDQGAGARHAAFEDELDSQTPKVEFKLGNVSSDGMPNKL